MKLFTCDHYPSPVNGCSFGCHDQIMYEPTAAMFLVTELAQGWANDEELDAFHSRLTPTFDWDTGEWIHMDGLDDAVNEVLRRPSLLDDGEGWCYA